jgi:hypothetical protein
MPAFLVCLTTVPHSIDPSGIFVRLRSLVNGILMQSNVKDLLRYVESLTHSHHGNKGIQLVHDTTKLTARVF